MLLGSSQILLMENVRESLAGRAALAELYPLTLPELGAEGWDAPIRLLNTSNLARTAGVSPTTAQRFLRYLETAIRRCPCRPGSAIRPNGSSKRPSCT